MFACSTCEEVTKQTNDSHCDRQVRRGQEGRGKEGVEQLEWSQVGGSGNPDGQRELGFLTEH